MPAYVIFSRERTLDPSELEIYARTAPLSLAGWPSFSLPTAAKRCLKDRLPRALQSRNFHPWKMPSNGTRVPSIKKWLSIDTKVRFIVASLWRVYNLEDAIRSFATEANSVGHHRYQSSKVAPTRIAPESARGYNVRPLRSGSCHTANKPWS